MNRSDLRSSLYTNLSSDTSDEGKTVNLFGDSFPGTRNHIKFISLFIKRLGRPVCRSFLYWPSASLLTLGDPTVSSNTPEGASDCTDRRFVYVVTL